MKNLAKLIAASFFGLGAMVLILTGNSSSRTGATEASPTPTASKASPTVTPTAGTLPTAANSATASPVKSISPENLSGASIGKKGCCDLDEAGYKGLVEFDHDAQP